MDTAHAPQFAASLDESAQAAGGCVPPDDEERVGQLPRVEHPGHHEAREGEGHPRARVRANDGGRGVFWVTYKFGTGYGKSASYKEPPVLHAKLAAGAR